MKKHRLLACFAAITVAASAMMPAAFAASFSDVDNDPTVSWAKDAIYTMADAGYIKGYEDGTFKPARSISKMECLLLMARILGVEEPEYAAIAKQANEMYASTVKKYNTTYVNELCYLLYVGVLQESDLVTYASSANANTELLRYQAAVLMSKLLGKNTEAKEFVVSKATYPDDATIPTAARAYVEFVTAQRIMNGMSAPDGTTTFSPNTSLTRAQMATLLSRLMGTINKSTYTGAVYTVDPQRYGVTIKQSHTETKKSGNADTVVYKNYTLVPFSTLTVGSEVQVYETFGHIQMMNILSEGEQEPEEEEEETDVTVVYANIRSCQASGSTKKVTLVDSENSDNAATYTATNNCTYTVKGSKANFSDLEKGMFAKAYIEDGKLIAIETFSDRKTEIEGILTEVDYDEDGHVYLYVTDEDDGSQVYVVAKKGAKVTRDGLASEYRDLSAGDAVELTLVSGKVTEVVAVGNTEKFTGVLKEIIISSNPAVTLMIDGDAETYKLRGDARIVISGEDATIYDLRPNITVTGTLDGMDVKTLVATSVSVTTNGEFTGTVSGVNTNYKVINVVTDDEELQNVYYSNKTNFLMSNGTSAKVKDLEKGATVSVTGTEKNGVFEATIIIIK